MACLHPLFVKNPLYDRDLPITINNMPTITAPCGHCFFCRKQKISELAMRVKHERITRGYKSVFVTFTYNDDNLPDYDYFTKVDLQKFFKRLRINIQREFDRGHLRRLYDLKHFSVGEFGHKHGRPHYHSVILGASRFELLPLIRKSWTYGFVYVKDCDNNASYYCTKYMSKDKSAIWWDTSISPITFYNAALSSVRKRKADALQGACFDKHCPLGGDCGSCPMFDLLRKHLLYCKRINKAEFNTRNRVSFNWKSINLGKDMALFHKEWAVQGFIPNGKAGDNLIKASVPRCYRSYYIKDYMNRNFRGMEYEPLNFSEVYPNPYDFRDSLSDAVKSAEYKQFMADKDPFDFSSSLVKQWYHLQEFRYWLAHRQYDVELHNQASKDLYQVLHGKDFGL